MESAAIAKQMIGFQKTIFESGFNTLSIAQDQTETLTNNCIGQFPWITKEGQVLIKETFAYTKKAREEFKKAIDEGYKNIEALFDKQ